MRHVTRAGESCHEDDLPPRTEDVGLEEKAGENMLISLYEDIM